MSTLIGIVLADHDLIIEHYRDQQGKSYYVGNSQRYQPKIARSSDVLQCFFKFSIPITEQKRMALKIKPFDLSS